MSEPPQTCVVDNTIFIDFYVSNLLSEFFRLPIRFVSPDVIIKEIDEPRGNELIAYGLKEISLSGKLVSEVYNLHIRYPKPSANDIAALILARDLQAILLTGDKELRKAANEESVSMHGTFWVFDQLIKSNLITPLRARKGLKTMLDKNRWLPKSKCTKRLKKWKACK